MKPDKTILITGATSGIGYQATKRYLNKGHKVIALCRNKDSQKSLYSKLKKETLSNDKVHAGLTAINVDLGSLFSIKQFIDQLLQQSRCLDAIVLNAGLQYTGFKEPRWSSDGIELTFAVNHLSHYYLAREIYPLLEKSISPRIIITSSEVHNPSSSGGKIGTPASLGELNGLKSGIGFSMVDGNSIFNADKAYKDSKLCNILFARKLYEIINLNDPKIPVIAWAPGLIIPRTNEGFFRYSRKKNEIGTRLFAFIARDLLNITETPSRAGELLYNLTLDEEYKNVCFSYRSNRLIRPGMKVFERSEISREAGNESLSNDLWNLSGDLVKYCLSLSN